MNGWYAVDLDGTLAEYHGWPANGSIGKPVPKMVDRVKKMIAEGNDVRIFTARVWPIGTDLTSLPSYRERSEQAQVQYERIASWCLKHIGRCLPITCVKDYGMIRQLDDRCRQVEANTGQLIGAED